MLMCALHKYSVLSLTLPVAEILAYLIPATSACDEMGLRFPNDTAAATRYEIGLEAYVYSYFFLFFPFSKKSSASLMSDAMFSSLLMFRISKTLQTCSDRFNRTISPLASRAS